MEHQTGGDEPIPDVIGSEAPPSRDRTRRGVAIATGVLVLVAAGGAAAWAATTTPDPSPAPSAGATPAPRATPGPGGAAPDGDGHRGPHAFGGDGHDLAGALHGELTVPDGASAYRKVLVQRGQVTAVSPTSLSVTSADGYAHTYVLNGETVVNGTKGDVSSLKAGDTVGVLAGDNSIATNVREPGAHMPGAHHMPPPPSSTPGSAKHAPMVPSGHTI